MDENRSAPLRVFVDTNVLFSADHSSQSAPGRILQLHRDGYIVIIVSQQVLDELVRNLREKLPSGLPVLQRLLNARPPEIIADPPQTDVDALAEAVNFDDAPIVAAALAAEADYFITGDRALREQAAGLSTRFRVASPRELLDHLESAP